MHELAVFYGVASESFYEEPARRVHFFKRDTAHIPPLTLSKFIRRGIRPSVARVANVSTTVGRPNASSTSQSRGWEILEEKQSVAPPDAWSDEEELGNVEENETELEEKMGSTRIVDDWSDVEED
jgi:hypothetical protein